MSIWEKLGFGGYKGFSHESDQLLRSAVELAGNLGCEKADTGHLLLAILQQDHGAAARFLEGKQIREPEVRRQLAESRRAPALHLDRYALAPDLKRTMDYAIIGAQNAHLNRAEPEHLLCAMLEDDGCTAGILLASMGVQLTDAVRECRQLSGQFVFPAQPRVSASMPRAARKAVSPVLMGRSTTPRMARTPPTGPSSVMAICCTTTVGAPLGPMAAERVAASG